MADQAPVRPAPRTDFHWGVYADATLAGLSVLIPIPLVDYLFETIFRNRMPADIARSRGQYIRAEAIQTLNRGDSDGCLESCLLLPIKLVVELVKRISKKLLYFLTIKDATDRISYYWHRAFLIDYALLLGQFDTAESTNQAVCAIEATIKNSEASPLGQFARQVIRSMNGLFRILPMLVRARFGRPDPTLDEEKKKIAAGWGDFAGYFRSVADRYDQVYLTQCKPAPQVTEV